MGVAEGLLTGKEGEKNNPVTLLLYPAEETTVRRAQKARLRLQMESKRWESRKAGRQRRGEMGREQQGTGRGGKRRDMREKEQGEGDGYQRKS